MCWLRSAKTGTICPGRSAVNCGSLQISRILWHSSALSYVAMAALAAVHAFTDVRELMVPALQRCEPYAYKHSQLMGTAAISDAYIPDLQGLPAVIGRGQSLPLSPLKAWIFLRRPTAQPP